MDGKRFLGDVTAGLTVSFAAISLGAAFGRCPEEVHLQA